MAETAVTLAAAGAKIDVGYGAPVDITAAGATARLDLIIASTGTGVNANNPPTLEVFIETSTDGSTSWREVGSFPQQTSAGTTRRLFAPLDRFLRCRWVARSKTVHAAASPSFEVSGAVI